MHLLIVMFLLAAVLDQSLGQDEDMEEDDELPLSGSSPELQKEIVGLINKLRRKVKPTATNMLKVIWNETLGANAKKWAERCIPHSSPIEQRTFDVHLATGFYCTYWQNPVSKCIGSGLKLHYLAGVQCGQTITQSDSFSSWEEIIDYWDENSKSFKYGVGNVNPSVNTHSYSQAIWYNSYMVGCGTAYCPKNRNNFLYICEYCPAGNVVGLIPVPYNKGPSCGDCRKHCEDKLCTNPCKYVDIDDDCERLKAIKGCKKANKKRKCNATCKCKGKII